MKIRLRLTLWNFIVMLFIQLTFSFILFIGMKYVLYEALDDDIEIFADTIEKSYNPFLGEFEEILWHVESARRYSELYLIVFNAAGRPVFSTPMTQLVNLSIPELGDNRQIGLTVSARAPAANPILRPGKDGLVAFRMIVRRMYYNGRLIGYLQAALPIGDVETALDKLLRIILLANLFAVILIASGGYLLTRNALKPILTITQKANQISHSNLDERIPVRHKKDELGLLSQTLNDLLARMQQAFESQQTFMADAAHELKTPLSVLRAHWESELNNPRVTDQLKEKIVRDVETISRLSRMINNLLLLSQSEAKYAAFEFDTVQLDQIIKDVVSNLDALAELKSQVIHLESLPEIKLAADPNKIYQLFFNLIENAIKYTQEEGTITISLVLEKEQAVVRITDNGPGIPQEDLPHIFKRFYRVHKDRARESGGSGLGLAICKLIARMHRGTIDVSSQAGCGTTFTVRLPVH